jgi:hypothetical protein
MANPQMVATEDDRRQARLVPDWAASNKVANNNDANPSYSFAKTFAACTNYSSSKHRRQAGSVEAKAKIKSYGQDAEVFTQETLRHQGLQRDEVKRLFSQLDYVDRPWSGVADETSGLQFS